MQSKIVMTTYKNGVKIGSGDHAIVDGHPGIAEFAEANFVDLIRFVGEGIAALFIDNPTLAQDAITSAKNIAGKVINGASKAYVASEKIEIASFDYDILELCFLAWSEDELKPETCQVIYAPKEAKQYSFHQPNSKQFVSCYSLDPNMLFTGTYPFRFGAQDAGWYYKVAAISSLDMVFTAVGVPAAYTTGSNNDTQHVVYRGEDGHIHELFAGDTWQENNISALANAPKAVGNPAAYTTGSNNDTQHVVYRGEDGHIHELFAGDTWQENNISALANAPKAG
jgi:hypothetical protein